MQDLTPSHLLVLGAPRSGTTLLAAMLGCHPEIALLNEDTHSASFRIFSKRIRGVKLCIPNQIELEHNKVMRVRDGVVRRVQERANAIRRRIGLRTPVPRNRKSDCSIRDYERLTDALHIVATLRSPHDVIGSIIGRGEQAPRTARYRWHRAVEILYQLSIERNDHTDLTLVDFDKLVTHPEGVMNAVLDRLGLKFVDEVLNGFRHTPQYRGSEAISADKASSGLEHALEHPLLRTHEDLRRKYLSLLESCL